MSASVACVEFRLKWGYYDSLKLIVYENVASYVFFLIVRAGTNHSSMREKGLTVTTSDDPSKVVCMSEVITLSCVWLGLGWSTNDGLVGEKVVRGQL